ncbi:hypothetical protein, partial [Pandoraea sputorum]|uniref:hypothetical protein n=1 Tax=Pandoraea sputorum TaxID=93222 RepID=UPI003556DF93
PSYRIACMARCERGSGVTRQQAALHPVQCDGNDSPYLRELGMTPLTGHPGAHPPHLAPKMETDKCVGDVSMHG